MQGQQMMNAQQLNQPMNNQQIQNQQIVNIQQSNQQPKLQQPMNQMLNNPSNDGNHQIVDPKGNLNNMSQMAMINQQPSNQIMAQNQAQQVNQIPPNHLQQPNQPMQRIPLQQNRMVLTNQPRAGLAGQQQFHMNRVRPNANIQMQQPNDQYFLQQQQLNQSNNPQQIMNQQQPSQFSQQTSNIAPQGANNMGNMNPNPMHSTNQMAQSPGNSTYTPSPQPNVVSSMGSPMNVNMIGQRAGGPASNPSPTLNTPIMASNASPRQPTNDDQLYNDKLRQLSKYIEPLKRLLNKPEPSDNANSSHELQKMRNLLAIITGSNKRCTIEILLKCEDVLEKMNLFGKANLASTSMIPSIPAQSTTSSVQPNTLSTISKDYDFCAPLRETILAFYKKPNFNHTLQRTFGPAVAAMTNNGFEYTDNYSSGDYLMQDDDVDFDEKQIPNIVQGEVAKLDRKFLVELDQLQHSQSKVIHLNCKIDDRDLPCVPPISVKMPAEYPDLPPRCLLNESDYNSTPFFKNIFQIFHNNLERLPNNYSLTTLLDRWELSIREALNCEQV